MKGSPACSRDIHRNGVFGGRLRDTAPERCLLRESPKGDLCLEVCLNARSEISFVPPCPQLSGPEPPCVVDQKGLLGTADPPLIRQKAFSIKKPPWGGGRISSQGLAFGASGRQDSNLRHLAPKASALPNCATPRRKQRLAVSVQLFSQVDAAADRSFRSAEARPCDPVATEPHGAGGAPLQLLR